MLWHCWEVGCWQWVSFALAAAARDNPAADQIRMTRQTPHQTPGWFCLNAEVIAIYRDFSAVNKQTLNVTAGAALKTAEIA